MEVIFKQKNKAAGAAKMKRLVGNSRYGTIGFCNFQLVKDFSDMVKIGKIRSCARHELSAY